MKIWKRIAALCLAAVIMTASMQMRSFSLLDGWNIQASAETYDIYTYTVSNGEATITDCDTSASGAIVIPSKIDGVPVRHIGDRAFYRCWEITNVVIPEGVKSIGREAFNCGNLLHSSRMQSVVIPASVECIGFEAFYRLRRMKDLYLTGSNHSVSIDVDAFYNCNSDIIVHFNGTVAQWCNLQFCVRYSSPLANGGTIYFNDVTVPKSLVIPEGVESISDYAFSNFGIIDISIPSTVTSIGQKAFDRLNNLSEIHVSDDNKVYSSENGVLFNKAKDHLIMFPIKNTQTVYAIPEGVEVIEPYAFSHASLISCTMPNSVRIIGSYAFEYCLSLTDMVLPDGLQTIGGYALDHCVSIDNVTIPDSVTEIGSGAFRSCYSLKSIKLPQDITIINSITFSGCTSLEELWIPNSVEEIEGYAFDGCESMTGIVVPESVQTIGSCVFDGCDNITVYAYPNSAVCQYCIDNGISYKSGTSFDVLLMPVGGTGLPNTSSIRVPFDSPVYPELPTVSKSDVQFLGWFTEEYGGQKALQGQHFFGDKTLYARWAKEFEVASTPSNLFYFVGDTVDSTGLVLRAVCDNGETLDIESGYTISPAVLTEAGQQTIHVSYEGISTSYMVTAYESQQVGLSVQTMPDKTSYFVGDTLDLTGLVLAVEQSSGNSQMITSGYECITPAQLTAAGSQRITLEYNQMYANFWVDVAEVLPEDIRIITQPEKKTFFTGDSLTTEGLELEVTYNNGNTEVMTAGYNCVPKVLNSAGTQTITVLYAGLCDSYDVTVTQKEIASLSVCKMPAQTVYYVGDTLNTKGIQLQAVYNDGSEKVITNMDEASFEYDFSSSGKKTVIINITEDRKTVQTSFEVTVFVPAEVNGDTVSATSGNEIAVPIAISGNNGIAGFRISLQYDEEVFTPVRVQAGELLRMNDDGRTFVHNADSASSGRMDVVWSSTENVLEDGVLFTAYFATNPSIGGTFSINISYSEQDTFDESFNSVQLICANAEVALDNSTYTSSPRIVADTVTAQAGNTAYIPIRLQHSDGLSTMVLNVRYQTEDLTFISAEQGTASVLAASATTNGAQIILQNAPSATDSVLLTLVLNVSEKASGDYAIELSDPTNSLQTVSGVIRINAVPSQIYAKNQVVLPSTDSISVPVYISGNHGIMGLAMLIQYDSLCLQLTEITQGEALNAGSLQKNVTQAGQAKIVYTSSSDTYRNGVLFVLEFQILSALTDQTTIVLDYLQDDTFNESWEDVVLECNDATISVKQTEIPPEPHPTIAIGTIVGKAGETVQVPITISDNPGLIGEKLMISYDPDILTLTDVTDGEILGTNNAYFGNRLSDIPYTLLWEDSIAERNYTGNGTLAVLTFTIDEDAYGQEATITLQYDLGSSINIDLQKIPFTLENGKVSVVHRPPVVNGLKIISFSGAFEQKVNWWKTYSSATMHLGFQVYGCDDAVRYVWSTDSGRVDIDQNGNISNTGCFARSARITLTAYDADGNKVAVSSVTVRFYKFYWQVKRLQLQEVAGNNIFNPVVAQTESESEAIGSLINVFRYLLLGCLWY